MKTSHIIMGVGAVGIVGYLLYKNKDKIQAAIAPATSPVPNSDTAETVVTSTVPVVMQKPQAETFIPIIKEPGQPKPEPINTVSPEPVSKPVYVAPVDNPSPVYTKPGVGFKKILVDDAVSGFNMY